MGLEIEVETLEEMCGEPEKDEDEVIINFDEALQMAEREKNLTIFDALIKAKSVLGRHQKIVVAISGGADSDVVLDLIEKTKGDKDVKYVWYNTGLEYQATKDHLKYLEAKYGIKLERERATKPIPTCCKEFGQPFVSKFVSEQIERLQRHNFKWEDKPFEELMEEYPNCKCGIMWWCNQCILKSGHNSRFNISRNSYLKEFLIAHPPTFRISNKCCMYSKKKVAKHFVKESNADLNVFGVRKAEGGVRSIAYKNCYSDDEKETAQFRPIFWFSDKDKEEYEKLFGIIHSDCYTKYGFTRTGCVGCPYNRNINAELEAVKKFEPLLYKACTNVFKDSYEYTKQYREFQAMMTEKSKQMEGQISLFDYEEE